MQKYEVEEGGELGIFPSPKASGNMRNMRKHEENAPLYMDRGT
mgnify:CR=1 FL=1